MSQWWAGGGAATGRGSLAACLLVTVGDSHWLLVCLPLLFLCKLVSESECELAQVRGVLGLAFQAPWGL